MRLEPVAERTAQHAAGGAGRPAFQHVVLAVEEICGIAWIEGHGRESWKRLELGARPLPAVADKIVDAESAGARGMRADRRGVPGEKIEIAMALAQNPKLVLLDEPFAGLSIDERQDVRELLIAIPREVTIVMIEHDMDVALDLADRITLLHFGEVIVEGTCAEVVADPRTREVYLGE